MTAAATKEKTRAASWSVISNASLTVGKLAVGLLIGSVSVISEAIHSGVDLLAAVIAWFAVRSADKPADGHHPYGHGKFENVSGAVEALLIFVAAVWIIFEAIRKLLHPAEIQTVGWGVAIMTASSLVNIVVSGYLFRVGKKTDSQALLADAWHLRTDVYTSAGVLFGLAVIWAGERFYPDVDWHWVDPVAAIAVALLIIKAAYDLTRDSTRDLLDASLPPDEVRWIGEYVSAAGFPIRSFHSLRTRKAGPYRFLDFHVAVPGSMSVSESHDIASRIEAGIMQRFPGSSVTVHIEPCDGENCDRSCREGCISPVNAPPG